MKKSLKTFSTLLVATALCFGIAVHDTPVAEAATNTKMIMLYVGKHNSGSYYANYSTSDLNAMTGVSQFLIVPAGEWPVYTTGGTNNYDEIINGTSTNDGIVDLVAKIKASNKANTPIWVSTPGMNSYSVPWTSMYLTNKNYLTKLQTALGTNWNSVNGIYYHCEYMYTATSSTNFDFTNLMNNPSLKLANDLSYYVHTTLDKKFIWAPFYSNVENQSTETVKRLAYTTNKTNIFDTVLVQPGWYFNPVSSGAPQDNLNGVKYSVQKQTITYRAGAEVVPRTHFLATIGVQMEIDEGISYSGDPRLSHYNDYVTWFSPLRNTVASGKSENVPFGYYAGARTGLFSYSNAVINKINSFYNF
ncbi:hypothetical protein [Tumebacillus lipolyticus]|uniref:Uncharacterized protein n=1 Tax=Tumebacillus lipolyticus TaxID=1280370 RepID=A0ABW5A0Z1_9BACL